MFLMVLTLLVKDARNIPFSEDWLLVPALTGHEPNVITWSWAQHNEHRNPLSRLILFALLKMTHGDFRAGMYFNVIVLGVLAASMIIAHTFRNRSPQYPAWVQTETSSFIVRVPPR